MIGGRNVASVCGIENVRSLIRRPMRSKAWILAGLVKAFGVNVIVTCWKRHEIEPRPSSLLVRRREHMLSLSSLTKIFFRIMSCPHKSIKLGGEVAITCACRLT